MRVTERAEWPTWRNRKADRVERTRARDVLVAALVPEGVRDLIDACAEPDIADGEAAARLLFHVFAEEQLPPEHHGPFVDALKALIRRVEYRSSAWRTCHAFIDSVLDRPQAFLDDDLAERGLNQEDYLNDLRAGLVKAKARAAAMAEPLSVEDCLRALEGYGVHVVGASQGEVLAWAGEWRASHAPRALSKLYDCVINPLPDGKIPLKAIVNLLGPPDDGGPAFVYYERARDAGLVLQGDENGFLSGRKLN